MIEEFLDEGVLQHRIEMVFIDERGEIEKGRGAGVIREGLSIFWREFANSLTSGAAEKVPCLRHDYQSEQWQSVARILVVGFKQEKYFPIMLSKGFIASCLFGEGQLTKECLLESFNHFLSRGDQETLSSCLGDDQCDPSENDEVMDVLSTYKCYRRVTKESLPKIIEELAHQELIQRPRYVSNSWAPIITEGLPSVPKCC